MKFYYKQRTAKNQCKVLSEEKGMLTIQMRNGGKFLVSKKSVLREGRFHEEDDLFRGITFKELIITLQSNEKVIDEKSVYKVFKEIMDYRMEDAKDVLKDNMKEILSSAKSRDT